MVVWLAVAVLVVGLAILFVVLAKVRPAYDAYGWLVWGQQAVHLRLDTSSAPSWKPLTFLFTFPYALIVGRDALYVWMVTAVAAGFSAPIFAGRIAYRLAGPDTLSRGARLCGAVFAGLAVVGLEGYWHFVLIATADPMMVALCLAALDCAVHGRPRAAWVLLILTCLGRPEASLIVLAYAVWMWRQVPGTRLLLIGGIAVIPLLWFGIAALTSYSWLIAAKVLDQSTTAVAGNKILGVLNYFAGLYEAPMQIAALAMLAAAVILRERRWLLVLAAVITWLISDIALALHGSGLAPRYLFEPAAVVVVLIGAAIGRLLRVNLRVAANLRPVAALRWLGVAALVALVATMFAPARLRARLAHNGILLGQRWALQIHRLHTVIDADGGPRAILACGTPVTTIPYQSILAWETERNVSEIGWSPAAWARASGPIVLFAPVGSGWQVRAIHSRRADAAGCRHLDRRTATDGRGITLSNRTTPLPSKKR